MWHISHVTALLSITSAPLQAFNGKIYHPCDEFHSIQSSPTLKSSHPGTLENLDCAIICSQHLFLLRRVGNATINVAAPEIAVIPCKCTAMIWEDLCLHRRDAGLVLVSARELSVVPNVWRESFALNGKIMVLLLAEVEICNTFFFSSCSYVSSISNLVPESSCFIHEQTASPHCWLSKYVLNISPSLSLCASQHTLIVAHQWGWRTLCDSLYILEKLTCLEI